MSAKALLRKNSFPQTEEVKASPCRSLLSMYQPLSPFFDAVMAVVQKGGVEMPERYQIHRETDATEGSPLTLLPVEQRSLET